MGIIALVLDTVACIQSIMAQSEPCLVDSALKYPSFTVHESD